MSRFIPVEPEKWAEMVKAQAEVERLKAEALAKVDPKLVQELVDQLFSYSELGMQEFETQKYLTNLLKAKGFAITLGYAGMPSAWIERPEGV